MSRELDYFRATVRSRERLSPHLSRLVVGGEGLREWRTSGVPDEALLLIVPDPVTGELRLPDEYPPDADRWERSRWYTVRAYDPDRQELTVDVIDHASGLATAWARRVRPGDVVGVSSTRHWYARPDDAEWQLLLGDITALPAIGRILAERSAGVRTMVFVEIPDPADRIELSVPPGCELRWRVNRGESALLQMLDELDLPATPGYVFVAGEAKATRDVRRRLRHTMRLPAARYSVVGYWRDRAEEWMRRYEAANIDLEEIYARGEAQGADAEDLADEVDRRLLEAGL